MRPTSAKGMLLAIVCAVLTCAGAARGAAYVVDQAAVGAADTNPGTEEKPWKTIQHAADAAKPGDTVYVMAGKYEERVKVNTSGAEGNHITFRAMPRHARAGVRAFRPLPTAWIVPP